MILVTGGTGLVGSRLLFDLVSEGKTVRALKRPTSSTKLFDYWTKANPTLRNKVEWVTGDVLDIYSLEAALVGIRTVYHCAAIVSFDPRKAREMEQTNIEGTANMLNLCLTKSDFAFFCHVSSVASLGRGLSDQITDEHSEWVPGRHNSNYAISKYGAEREVWRSIAEGLPAAIVNPSVILGPGDWKNGSSSLFYKVWKGFPFYTDGMNGFVDVADVSAAMRMLTEKNITGERYILNAANVSFKDLFTMIAEQLKVKAPSVKVQHWMSSIVWRLEMLRCFFTRKSPFITKETAASSRRVYRYTSAKIEKIGFAFRPIELTVAEVCKVLVEQAGA